MKRYIDPIDELEDDLSLLTCSQPGCTADVAAICAPIDGDVIRLCSTHWRAAKDGVEQVAYLERAARRESAGFSRMFDEHLRIEAVGETAKCAYHGTRCPEGFGWQFESLSPIEQYQHDGR